MTFRNFFFRRLTKPTSNLLYFHCAGAYRIFLVEVLLKPWQGGLMAIPSKQSGTDGDEIFDEIYRKHTFVVLRGAGGFSFNQNLIIDEKPLNQTFQPTPPLSGS